MDLIEELKGKFSVEKIEPWGLVVVVPSREFQPNWEASLESEGHRVFSNSYGGELVFLIRLTKSKPRSVSIVNSKPSSASPRVMGFSNYRSNRLSITKNREGGVNKEMSKMPIKTQYKLIPEDLIESTNPSREVFEDMASLTRSIQKFGLLHPLLVKVKRESYGFELLVGERRLRACRNAGLEEIPCIIVDEVTDEQALEMQFIENFHRSDLKVFEEVRIVKTLRDRFGLTHKEIASKIELSHGTVGNYLFISQLPEEVQRLIGRQSHSPRDLTITKAVSLAQANLPPNELDDLVKLIRAEGLTTAELAKKLAKKPSHKIKRVHRGRMFWRELTKTLRDYARYWSDYATLREWEDIDSYHLELQVTCPKDVKEAEQIEEPLPA